MINSKLYNLVECLDLWEDGASLIIPSDTGFDNFWDIDIEDVLLYQERCNKRFDMDKVLLLLSRPTICLKQ